MAKCAQLEKELLIKSADQEKQPPQKTWSFPGQWAPPLTPPALGSSTPEPPRAPPPAPPQGSQALCGTARRAPSPNRCGPLMPALDPFSLALEQSQTVGSCGRVPWPQGPMLGGGSGSFSARGPTGASLTATTVLQPQRPSRGAPSPPSTPAAPPSPQPGGPPRQLNASMRGTSPARGVITSSSGRNSPMAPGGQASWIRSPAHPPLGQSFLSHSYNPPPTNKVQVPVAVSVYGPRGATTVEAFRPLLKPAGPTVGATSCFGRWM